METKIGGIAGSTDSIRWKSSVRFLRKCQKELARPTTVFSALLALGLALTFYRSFNRWLSGGNEKQVRYLVARYALPNGHLLQLADLKLAVNLPDTHHALSDQELHLIKGARLRGGLAKNEPLRQHHLVLSPQITGLARSVPRGYRAYQMMLSHRIFVNVGDRVDVLSLPPDPFPAAVIAESVEVLQVRTGREMSVLIVAVHRDEIGKLEKAQQRGKLTIALRNPNDHGRHERRRHSKAKPRPRIEVFAEE